ncbi:GNAT family N-acetyltransferase [Ornithinibacillus bavariensis]|uniref:GNAT family N-acetyltransferase n=1 Tax=Ornithinibacillus bavariensis TaxID=545502 RepID=UPI000EE387A9|nr:N-acetyltransferase [Ornithinibacillus sp.]
MLSCRNNALDIKLAVQSNTNEVLAFFDENIDMDSGTIYNREFVCPDGVKAAIRRNQMLIAIKDDNLVGALRFYKKKTDNSVSLYQFAICKTHRNRGLLKDMLSYINAGPVRATCPKHSSINHYFRKTGWTLYETKGELNSWEF